MKIKAIVEISVDTEFFTDDVLNSDTIGDYKAQLDCDVANGILYHFMNNIPNVEEIKILSTEPYDEGIEEYGNYLNKWQEEYNKRMKNFKEKYQNKK